MITIHTLIRATAASVLVLFAVYAGATDGIGSRTGLGLKAPQSALSEQIDSLHQTEQPQTTFYLGERNMPRLGMQETESYGGISKAFTARWASSIETSVTRESVALLPQYALSGRIERTLAPGQSVSLGLKMSSLDRSGGYAAAPGLLRLPGNQGAGATGYELNMSYRYGNGNRLGMYYQLAPLQSTYPGLVAGTGPYAFMLSSEHQLSAKWALSYDISGAEPGAILRSPNLGLGLRYRF